MLSALVPRTVALMLRRLTRTQGVRWPRNRLYVPGTAGLIALLTAATVGAYRNHPDDPLVISFYRPSIALLLVILAGAAIITMEGSRDRSGATERALECLPLTRRSATFLVRLPSLGLAALVLLLPTFPLTAALAGIGTPFWRAVAIVVAALGSGLLTIAVPYALVSLMMRSDRWDSVRFPTIILLWALAAGLQVASALRDLADPHTAPPLWTPVARTLHAIAADALTATDACALGLLGAGAALTMGLLFSLSPRAKRPPAIRRPWSGDGPIARTAGEFRYALRDPATCANGALSLLLSALVVTATVLLPEGLRPHVEPVALLALGAFGSAPARTIRGIYPLSVPPQRVLGLTATSWALSTSVVVIGVAAVLLAPGLVLVTISTSPWGSAAALLSTFLLSAASAIAIGSVLPVAPQNVLGQGLASGLTLAVFLTMQQLLSQLLGDRTGVIAIVAALILGIAIAVAVAAETIRWLPPAAHRHKGDPHDDD